MPVNHEAVAALPAAGGGNHQLLRDLTVRRMPYVLGDAEDSRDLVAIDPTSGASIIDILQNGRVYHYDPTDTTSVHDGVSVLVSYEGKRYKLSANADVLVYSVLDNTITTPPGSPGLGDAYIVAAASTGDWAGHDNEIAVFTARGWEFITASNGRIVYVEASDSYYHLNLVGVWVAGFGSQSLPAGSVPPSALIGGGDKTRWIVQNQTTNTPPAVTNGAAYLVGGSPTGAWAGKSGKIAHGEGGAWVFYTANKGWRIYDVSQGTDYLFNGTTWDKTTGSFRIKLTKFTANGTFVKEARCFLVRVWVTGGGGGNVGNGGTTSFGTLITATGGVGGGGANGTSAASEIASNKVRCPFMDDLTGSPGGGVGTPGAGGMGVAHFETATVPASVGVVVGAGGSTGAPFGVAGAVVVEEFIAT